jgi:uncharacterized membrane protein
MTMTILMMGLAFFLGVHSIRVLADDWRTAQRARIGAARWKMAYTVASLIGFALIIWGYSLARQAPFVIWHPPLAMRHIAALLTLIAFILLAASKVPRNAIKARLHHPMLLGVKVWALAHLLANGSLAAMLLFGSFLAWSVLAFRAARQRDRAAGAVYPAGTMAATLATVGAGVAAWALFAFWLHGMLIGVRPFG